MLKTISLTLTLMLTFALAQMRGPFDIYRVTDGDTLRLEIDGKLEYLRFIGVDSPETWRRIEPFGLEATAFVRSLVAGKQVMLEPGLVERDRFGRLLAYAFVDGRDVGLQLLQAGLARVQIIDDARYRALYEAAEAGARSVKKGMWHNLPGRFVDRNCNSFKTQGEAQAFFGGARPGDVHRLDADGDGVACGRLPTRSR